MLKKTDAGNPRDWMAFVRADLAAVRLLARHRVSFHVCRSKLAEAFEKALKADLLDRGWNLARIHDLQKLGDELAARDGGLAGRLQPLVDELAESYTESRYPGFDLDQPDWPGLDRLRKGVARYVALVRKRLKR